MEEEAEKLVLGVLLALQESKLKDNLVFLVPPVRKDLTALDAIQ